mgnify:CR=1 FL=1
MEEKSNVIEINCSKELKKYKKILRKEKKHNKNKNKIKNIEQAIEEYTESKCESKLVRKSAGFACFSTPVKTKLSKSKESDEILDKEFQKNKKFHKKIDDFDKRLKEERRKRHEEFNNKKEFDRKKGVAKNMYKKKYMKLFNKWIENLYIIKEYNKNVFVQWKNILIISKYIQGKKVQQMKIIFQKWKTSFISKAKINAKSIQRFFNQWKYRYICQICYEITPSRVKFKCGHSMCKVCSNKWFKKSPDNINRIKNGYDVKMSCHICRGEVKKNDTIIVYNRQYINDYDIIHYLEENFISGIIAIEFNNVPMYGTCNKFKLIAIIIDSANKLIDIYRTIRGEKGMRYAEYFIEEVVDML